MVTELYRSAFRFQAVEDIVNLTEKSSSAVAKGQANWGKIDLQNCEMFQMFPNLGVYPSKEILTQTEPLIF